MTNDDILRYLSGTLLNITHNWLKSGAKYSTIFFTRSAPPPIPKTMRLALPKQLFDSNPNPSSQISVRDLLGEFFDSCESLPAGWYRIFADKNAHLPSNSNKKAYIQPLSRLLGMRQSLCNDLLEAAGLQSKKGDQFIMSKDGWDSLKS